MNSIWEFIIDVGKWWLNPTKFAGEPSGFFSVDGWRVTPQSGVNVNGFSLQDLHSSNLL